DGEAASPGEAGVAGERSLKALRASNPCVEGERVVWIGLVPLEAAGRAEVAVQILGVVEAVAVEHVALDGGEAEVGLTVGGDAIAETDREAPAAAERIDGIAARG